MQIMNKMDNLRSGSVRIIVADDHPVVLLGIQKVMEKEEDMEIVAVATDIATLEDKLSNIKCDVLICDFIFENSAKDGFKLLEKIKRTFPRLRVLILTMHDDPLLVQRLISSGASGFITKGSSAFVSLGDVIRTVMKGEIYIDPETATMLSRIFLQTMLKDGSGLRKTTLSKREYEVVRMFTDGMTIGKIASSTYRSIKTVSTQKKSAMKKLAARNDAELVIQFYKYYKKDGE